MRLTFSGNPGSSNDDDSKALRMTGPLILLRDPLQPLEAATKQYVDNAFNNLDASNLKAGVIPISRLPGFNGDLISVSGSNVMTLSETGVTAGVYTKVNVNAKGRVISASQLTNADIPNFSWSKIGLDKPTTLAGYGIIDGVSVSGGVLYNTIKTLLPTANLHPANYEYIDNKIGNISSLKVGDIIRWPVLNPTPTGFLRCNGGSLDKTIYAALYAVVEDTFTSTDNYKYGAGKPWIYQYKINNNDFSSVDIIFPATTNSGDMPISLAGHKIFITKNKGYIVGGRNSSIGTSKYVYMSTLSASGFGNFTDLRSIKTTPLSGQGTLSLPADIFSVTVSGRSQSGTSSTNNLTTTHTNTSSNAGSMAAGTRIYRLEGKGGDGGTSIQPCYGRPCEQQNNFNTTGQLTITVNNGISEINFVNEGGIYLAGASNEKLVNFETLVTKNRAFVIGGQNNLSSNNYSNNRNIYSTIVNSNGTLAAFPSGTTGPVGHIPQASFINGQIVVSDLKNGSDPDIYMIGGQGQSSVFRSKINADGTLSTWSATASLPTNLHNFKAFVTSRKIFVFGGNDGTSISNKIYKANINTDGSLATWEHVGNMPKELEKFHICIAKKLNGTINLFVLGGVSSTGNNLALYKITISNTTGELVAPWVSTQEFLPDNIVGGTSISTSNAFMILNSNDSNPQVNQAILKKITISDGELSGNSTIRMKDQSLSSTNKYKDARTLITSGYIYVIGGEENAFIRKTPFIGGVNDYSTYYTSDLTIGRTCSITINGVTHNFPGGNGGPANNTNINVDYSFNANTPYTYDAVGGTITIKYQTTSQTTGANSVITIQGENSYTFLGGVGGPADNQTYTLFLPGNVSKTLNYNVATGSNINVVYADTATSNTNGTVLPYPISDFELIVTKNRVYTLGGLDTSSVSHIFTAPINADGTLGQWTTSGISLPAAIHSACAIVTESKAYLIGGKTLTGQGVGTSLNTVYSSTINADGTLNAFVLESNLPAPVSEAILINAANKVHLIGGRGNNAELKTIYTAEINNAGTIGQFSLNPIQTPDSITGGHGYCVTKQFFLFNNKLNHNYSNCDVYRGTLNSDGSIGTIIDITNVTNKSRNYVQSAICVIKDKIYLFGGKTAANTETNNIISKSITGGLNDYSPYYDGSILGNVSSTFNLPDLSGKEKFDEYFYIKY